MSFVFGINIRNFNALVIHFQKVYSINISILSFLILKAKF